jgi:hypothetical protein
MINNVERVQRSLAICMWVGRVSTILRELREDPESLDLVDLGPIGDFGLWDTICERLITFDGDRCDGDHLYLPPNLLSDDSAIRFSVPSGESAGQFLQILNFPI